MSNEIVEGTIVHAKVDTIVNAANPMMQSGAGVDGAIHKATGPKLLYSRPHTKSHCHLHSTTVSWHFHGISRNFLRGVWFSGKTAEKSAIDVCIRPRYRSLPPESDHRQPFENSWRTGENAV